MKKQIFKLMTIAISLLVILTACKKNIAVTGVTLNKVTLTLGVGDTETLMATIQPVDATNKNTTWESSNVAVATVLNGFVAAVSPGTATITVHTEDGNKTATCTVIVKAATPLTKEELLTQEKGWKITSATSDPPYELGDGTSTSNLFNGYFYDCELDDIIFFLKDKTQFLDPGKKLCDNYPSGNLGNWDLLDNEQKLQFHFLDIEGLFEATILILDKTTLKLSLAMEEDDGMKTSPKYRGVRGDSKTVKNYVFTLTYTKP